MTTASEYFGQPTDETLCVRLAELDLFSHDFRRHWQTILYFKNLDLSVLKLDAMFDE